MKIDDVHFGEVNPTGVGGDRVIMSKRDVDGPRVTFLFFIEGDKTTADAAPLIFQNGDASKELSFVRSQPLAWQADRWYHVAVVRSGAQITFYRDGVAVGDAQLGQAPLATPEAPLALGALPQADGVFNPLKGALDEPEIFSRALSATRSRRSSTP